MHFHIKVKINRYHLIIREFMSIAEPKSMVYHNQSILPDVSPATSAIGENNAVLPAEVLLEIFDLIGISYTGAHQTIPRVCRNWRICHTRFCERRAIELHTLYNTHPVFSSVGFPNPSDFLTHTADPLSRQEVYAFFCAAGERIDLINAALPENLRCPNPSNDLLLDPTALTQFLQTAYDHSLCIFLGKNAGIPENISPEKGASLIRSWLASPSRQQINSIVFHEQPIVCLPREVCQLRELEELGIIAGHLCTLPSEIGQLTQLKNLDVSCNHLSYIPEQIDGLHNLESLDVSSNILDTLPNGVGGLIKLKHLFSNYNFLTRLPREIGLLVELESLCLYENELEELPVEIERLESLKHLNVTRNYLRTLPIEIGHLQSLVSLSIDENLLESFPPGILNLSSLEILCLHKNQLKAVPVELMRIQGLQLLDLRGNPVGRIPEELKTLSKQLKLLTDIEP